MKRFCSVVLLGCLVTSPLTVIAGEDQETGTAAMSCEQEAREMGMTKAEDISAYVKACEEANDSAGMSDTEDLMEHAPETTMQE